MNKKEKLLFKASETGDMATVVKLTKPFLFVSQVDVNVKNEFGDTALILASIKGFRNIVGHLLENGALIDEVNFHGDTALICSAKKGHRSVTSLLIANGAEVNAINSSSDSALIYALKYNHIDVAEMLIANGADVLVQNGMPLFLALEIAPDSLIKSIISAGAPINIRDANGDTPLILAIVWHNYEIAKLLITQKADVNAVNKFGTTPLVQAVRNNNIELVNLLISKGADVNVASGAALMYAIENGYKAVAETLINHGTVITTRHGAALIQTYANGHKEIAELLLKNKTGQSGNESALIGALERGSRQLADMPIAAAATDNVQAKNSTIALIHALQQGHRDLAAILSSRRSQKSAHEVRAAAPADQGGKSASANNGDNYRALNQTDFVVLLIYDNYSLRDKAFDLLCMYNRKYDTFIRHIEKRKSNNPTGEITVFGVKREVNGIYYIVMQNPDNGYWGSPENAMLRENDCSAKKNLVLTYQEILGFSTADKKPV